MLISSKLRFQSQDASLFLEKCPLRPDHRSHCRAKAASPSLLSAFYSIERSAPGQFLLTECCSSSSPNLCIWLLNTCLPNTHCTPGLFLGTADAYFQAPHRNVNYSLSLVSGKRIWGVGGGGSLCGLVQCYPRYWTSSQELPRDAPSDG